MVMTKYQSVEKAEVLTPDEHRRIEAGLHRLGKTSAQDLTEEQRQQVLSRPEQK
jgi:hypothetical protein